jgi:hypothetical protein
VPNSNKDIDTKIDDNSNKLEIKYIISMIKTQVNNDIKTVDFLNLEVMLNLV